jgi:hypothetical protein
MKIFGIVQFKPTEYHDNYSKRRSKLTVSYCNSKYVSEQFHKH